MHFKMPMLCWPLEYTTTEITHENTLIIPTKESRSTPAIPSLSCTLYPVWSKTSNLLVLEMIVPKTHTPERNKKAQKICGWKGEESLFKKQARAKSLVNAQTNDLERDLHYTMHRTVPAAEWSFWNKLANIKTSIDSLIQVVEPSPVRPYWWGRYRLFKWCKH